jgi:hypothetical protein
MAFARYYGDWVNQICLIILENEYRTEQTYDRDSGTIIRESKIIYMTGTNKESYAGYYRACGYKEVAGLAEYEAEIAAMEGQQQLIAEHIEEIERSHVA